VLDIEFLQKANPKSHTLHLYDLGCFRSEVTNLMRRTAEERGWVWQELDPAAPSLDGAGVLFDEALISVDLDAVLAQPDAEQTVAGIAEAIKESTGTVFYLHGRGGGSLNDWPAWDVILGATQVLHEPRLTPAALPKLLAYLGPSLTLPPNRVTNQSELDTCLREWVAAGEVTLPRFLSSLDVLLVSCVGDDGTFDAAAFRAATVGPVRAPTHWAVPIARFLRTKSNPDRVAFLAELDRSINQDGVSPREVMSAVRRATYDLAKSNAVTNPGAGVLPDGWSEDRWQHYRAHNSLRLPVLMVWQTVLLNHEPNLIGQGMVAWNHLLRSVQTGAVEKS
jgi:hypothetical protein